MAQNWYRDNFYRYSPELIKTYKSLMRSMANHVPMDGIFAAEKEAFRGTWGSQQHIAALESALKKSE